MNPLQLLGLIKKANHLEREDFSELMKIHEAFPFFQIPKVLLAKYEFGKTEGNTHELLHWAAVTSPDRLWLKKMVESETPFEQISKAMEEKYQAALEAKNKPAPENFIDDLEEEQLIPKEHKPSSAKDLTATLKKLGEDLAQSKLKALEKLENGGKKPEKPITVVPVEPSEDIKLKNLKSEPLAETTNPKPKPEEPIAPKPKRKHRGDELIESIKRKEKKKILDEKKKEQIDIIRAFSKKEIKLATLKEIEGQQKQDDLSEKSTKLNSGLITESYAKILVKQGKIQKAKEIYKKLMVKFPEKNTYFADLIKELEENNP